MNHKKIAVLIVTFLIVLYYFWNRFNTPDIEIQAKWITAKVICPERKEVESVVLLEPKGYRVIVFLKKDQKLLEYLKNNKQDVVSFIVESRRSGKDLVDIVEYPVSIAGFELDKSWVLNLRNKNCSVGNIEGHK